MMDLIVVIKAIYVIFKFQNIIDIIIPYDGKCIFRLTTKWQHITPVSNKPSANRLIMLTHLECTYIDQIYIYIYIYIEYIWYRHIWSKHIYMYIYIYIYVYIYV